jgi:hypothetical protein
MAGGRQLLLYWDPELDGAFRRRLERALYDLGVNAADASAVDVDPDAPAPVRLALVSARGSAIANADIAVQAGPGDFPKSGSALRLEARDIEDQTRRWAAFVDRLGGKLGRPGLAVAPEDLEVRLGEASRRAEEAERALADMERQRNDALRTARHAETSLAAERVRAAGLEREAERLRATAESTAFSLSSAPPHLQEVLALARDHAWRARLAAARADEAALAHTDALSFPKAHATYSGETHNRLPHGFGVMTFRDGAAVTAIYRGAFEAGQRSGHGIAASDGGLTWSGEWNSDEAAGLGVLETQDGRRFEGEVTADETGTPKQVRGWTWEAGRRVSADPHRPVAPLLPSPAQQASRG